MARKERNGMLNIEWTSSPKDSIDWLSGILYKLIDYLSLKYPGVDLK